MNWRRRSGQVSAEWSFVIALAMSFPVAVYFYRSASFSRVTTVLVWLALTLAAVLLAATLRRWAPGTTLPLDESLDRSRSFDYEITKRVFDVIGAALLLIASAPLLAAWYFGAALGSTGPVLIRQERIGRLGRRFEMLKLRTLPPETLATADRDWSVPAASSAMTFVRQSGLDELPQLWNVLRGEMSLVGPRPERPYFVERFSEELPSYPARHQLHAGLTGWAQVNGLRGNSSIAKRLQYDLDYLQRWSLGLDAWILLLTGWAVVRDLCSTRGVAEGALR